MLVVGWASFGSPCDIKVTPAPKPQEVLPPKPIIVAPMMVRQHSSKKKLTIIRNGRSYAGGVGMRSPYGNMPAPFYPPFGSNLVPFGPGARSLRNPLGQFAPFPPPQFLPMGPFDPSGSSANSNDPRYLTSQNIFTVPNNGAPSPITISREQKKVYMTPDKYAESLSIETTDKLAKFANMVQKIEELERTVEEVDKGIDKVDGSLKNNFKSFDNQLQKIEMLRLTSHNHGFNWKGRL